MKKMKFLLVMGIQLSIVFGLVAQVQLGNDINGVSQYDRAGSVVSLSGDGTRFAVAASHNDDNGMESGHVRIYEYNGFDWVQLGKDLQGDHDNAFFGVSISLSFDGSRIAVGARDVTGSSIGEVKIFEFNGFEWGQIGQTLYGDGVDDGFSSSVALNNDGSIVAVGAKGFFSIPGYVRTFEFDGASWDQLGKDVTGDLLTDSFGASVSINSAGNRMVVGVPGGMVAAAGMTGRAQVYDLVFGEWQNNGVILGQNDNDQFGSMVQISDLGNHIVVGAPYNDDFANNAGQVRVYYFSGTWNQAGQPLNGQAAWDRAGHSGSISKDGSRISIGIPYSDDAGVNAGKVQTFDYNAPANSWNEVFPPGIDGDAAFDSFGFSVSLSADGNTLGIGIPFADTGGMINTGMAKAYNFLSSPFDDYVMYPNPTSGMVTLDGLTNKEGEVSIMKLDGEIVYETELRKEIDLDLPPGSYLLKIKTSEGSQTTRLEVKTKE